MPKSGDPLTSSLKATTREARDRIDVEVDAGGSVTQAERAAEYALHQTAAGAILSRRW